MVLDYYDHLGLSLIYSPNKQTGQIQIFLSRSSVMPRYLGVQVMVRFVDRLLTEILDHYPSSSSVLGSGTALLSTRERICIVSIEATSVTWRETSKSPCPSLVGPLAPQTCWDLSPHSMTGAEDTTHWHYHQRTFLGSIVQSIEQTRHGSLPQDILLH